MASNKIVTLSLADIKHIIQTTWNDRWLANNSKSLKVKVSGHEELESESGWP